MTEEEKAAQKAKPVATTPIPGTPWYVLNWWILFFVLLDYLNDICRKKQNMKQILKAMTSLE